MMSYNGAERDSAERERMNRTSDAEQEAVEYFRAGAEPGSLHERYADAIEERGDEYRTLRSAFYKVQDRAEAAERRVDDLAEHLAYLLEHGHLDETGKRHVAAVLVRHAVVVHGDDPHVLVPEGEEV